jgi:hypothetical protein
MKYMETTPKREMKGPNGKMGRKRKVMRTVLPKYANLEEMSIGGFSKILK